MRTVVDEITDLGKTRNFSAWQQSGYEGAKWIVVDCVNVVVHVFDTESRDFYDLELLWGDAPRIDWRKELGLPPELEAPPRTREDEEEEEALAEEMEGVGEVEAGDADLDEEAEIDEPVETEFPDESTGSNSVEFVEIDPPSKRGEKGRDVFPVQVEGGEDETLEEQAMGSLDKQAEAAAEIEEEEAEAASARGAKKPARKAAKKAPAKKVAKKVPAKKAAKKVVKKPAIKTVKKPAKKAAPKTRKTAAKKPVKSAKKKKK
jgi:hypothetical protein